MTLSGAYCLEYLQEKSANAMSLGGAGRIGFKIALSVSSAEVAKDVYLSTVEVFALLYRDSEINEVYFGIIRVLGDVMSPMALLVSASSLRKAMGLPWLSVSGQCTSGVLTRVLHGKTAPFEFQKSYRGRGPF